MPVPKLPTLMLLTAMGLIPMTLGCGGEPAGEAPDLDALADQFDQQAVVEEARSDYEGLAEAARVARADADRLAREAPSDLSPTDMTRGKKMKGSGILRTPLKAGIVAEQKLNMIQWRQALDLYAATNNLDYPETHEEFMEKVIEANDIQLEPLLEPYEYWYNAEISNLQKRIQQETIDAAEQAAQEAEAALAAATQPQE